MNNKTLFLFSLLLISAASYAVNDPSIDNLIARVSEGTAKNILTEIKSGNGEDFFEIESKNGNIIISGNNSVSIATGFNWYLKYVAGIHISWNNLTQKMPKKLPPVEKPIRQATNQHLRYYLNYCTFSYSMPFWDWERWQKELDWMAMHGINLSLSITGNEVVWYNLLKRNGYTREEINEFIAGPAFMAWWQMNNLEGWGGPNPDEWYTKQEALQKKILARMNELGIEPVMPGFAGMVPRNIDKKLGYKINDPGTWCTFNRPAFLNTDEPNFNKFADMYYEELTKLYGKANYYSMDPFHEGGSTKGVDLNSAGQIIMNAMKRTNPKAVWVAQAWHRNPRQEMIENLNQHDLLILDLYSEKDPQWGDPVSGWHRANGFGKHDWLYCMLLNFGGRTGLHGKMDRLINSYYDAVAHPHGKMLKGVGTTPEAIENNPIMFELLYELPWRNERFSKNDWVKSYTKARYGKESKAVNEAWEILAQSSYNCPDDFKGQGTVESLFCARPGINLKRASTWGWSVLYYDPENTRMAAQKMLSAAAIFKNNENFKYDLVDILRQSIADRGNLLSSKIAEAYEKKDTERFKILADSFLTAMQCQDKLLATHRDFRVGTWTEQAKSLSEDDANRKLYEWNARTLITVWGNKSASEQGGLHDYSNREWNGILGDLYYQRWKLFFENKIKEMSGEKVDPIDFFQMEENWTYDTKPYSNRPEGDVFKVGKEVYKTIFGDIN